MVSVSISRNIQQGVDPASTYILEEQIGDGSFGEVFKGKLKKTGETVAVKIVAIQDDEELMEFQVEIDILFKCNDPNIIKIHAAYLWKRTLYMVLEYCGGGSLDDIYEQLESPLDEPQIKEVCYYTLQALVFMHANHMVHRDIKAGNVLLTNAGEVKIADFGVSALNSGPNMRRDTFIGTPYWMAPEVIACETSKENPYDELCDIWSVGITAIEFAQMNPPYHDLHPMRVLFRIPKSVPPKLSDPDAWSPEFNDFIHQCLIKDPAQRASAKKMLQHPFFTANGYKPTHSEMLRLLAERSSIEESMESVSIGEDASGDDVSMDEMTDNVSRMSVVEHSDAADGPKPFLAPKPQTEERKVNVVKTRTIRNTDGTFKRVTTKKKLTEVENTRQVRKAKENQIQAVRKQARLERVESKTREASNIRTLEIAMREQASQLAIVRRRHQDNVDSIQRTMNRELDKHKSSMPDLLKQKERMLRKKRDKDLAEQTSLIDTQTKYGLKELKAQLKKNDYSKADVKTKLEVYEKTHSQEKNDRLKEWRRAQRAQHNKSDADASAFAYCERYAWVLDLFRAVCEVDTFGCAVAYSYGCPCDRGSSVSRDAKHTVCYAIQP
ncbi:STE/STE20/SLK protein kinase [Sphaeroforma arctica JP610]|uniref:non-specific serine/threonine protein kinase n=1 Tax=Sphaeroforma arctica JP610 TaxID=667725 RepID=A0A0L0FUJ8_9EUKA|nr:STE/STE20/SLK protein kinase [Sphaeroforma arctica JP610]KNC80507.1 STE/STE20/SLK protein kinase [Sphaeroforma arctica JP610]|eukprot:XP_014154409.1 STE/STE20/SLK protein kinase [Sphaeroforma arctica JP610]